MSLRRFTALAAANPGAGVLRLEALELFPAPVAAPAWSSAAEDFQAVDPSALPAGFAAAITSRTAVVGAPNLPRSGCEPAP